MGEGASLIFAVGALVIAGAVLVIGAAAGVLWWRNKHDRARPGAPAPPPAPPPAPRRLGDTLRTLHAAARWAELLRLLDRTQPEWVVVASLIETARGVAELEEDTARARQAGVSEEVIGRLELQAGTVANGLWSLADRIAAADELGSARLRDELAQQDEALVRLLDAIVEAREGLAELSLSDVAGADDLRRAAGRFQALAATARELNAWEREQVPW